MNRKYEMIFILNPNLGEEGLASTVEKVKKITEDAGTLDSFEEWGNRRLAYEIDDQKDGFYYLMRFTSEVDFPAELERVLKITDGVMRFLVIRLDD